MPVSDILDAALGSDPDAFRQAFNDEMSARLSAAVSDKRLQLAASLFANPEVEPEEAEDPDQPEEEQEDDVGTEDA